MVLMYPARRKAQVYKMHVLQWSVYMQYICKQEHYDVCKLSINCLSEQAIPLNAEVDIV